MQNAFVPVMWMLWHYVEQQRDQEMRVLEHTKKHLYLSHTKSLKRKRVGPPPRYNKKMCHTQ